LKNIDKCFNDSNTNINTRLSKIEDNQNLLLDRMSSIESLLNKINNKIIPNGSLNKNIEYELLEKMKKMNVNNNNNYRVELKPEELTFSNILENNYDLQDINTSISNYKDKTDLVNSFSSSSGSSYYSNDMSSDMSSDMNNNVSNDINNDVSNDMSNDMSNVISNELSNKLDKLNSLLF